MLEKPILSKRSLNSTIPYQRSAKRCNSVCTSCPLLHFSYFKYDTVTWFSQSISIDLFSNVIPSPFGKEKVDV